MPAAGPGASGVLHLLRPAASTSADSSAAMAAMPAVQVQKPEKVLRKMSSLAEASFSMSAATLEAAAASVFGSSKTFATTAKSNTAKGLLGLSCIIGARGEVRTFRLHMGIQ